MKRHHHGLLGFPDFPDSKQGTVRFAQTKLKILYIQ